MESTGSFARLFGEGAAHLSVRHATSHGSSGEGRMDRSDSPERPDTPVPAPSTIVWRTTVAEHCSGEHALGEAEEH